MKILDPGHKYELDHLDGTTKQILTFVKREGDNYPGNQGHYEGTNLQEVLRAIIDRLEYLNHQAECAETQACSELARIMLLLLEIRASRRHGLTFVFDTLHELQMMDTCPECGHIQCEHRRTK